MKAFANDKNISDFVQQQMEQYNIPKGLSVDHVGTRKGIPYESANSPKNAFQRGNKADRFKRLQKNQPLIPNYAKDVGKFEGGLNQN